MWRLICNPPGYHSFSYVSGGDYTRVGIIVYSDSALLQFKLSTYDTAEDVILQFDTLPYPSKSVSIADPTGWSKQLG